MAATDTQAQSRPSSDAIKSGISTWDAPWSGSALLVGTGKVSIMRIPVPGTKGLVLTLFPHPNYSRQSTSSVFIQNLHPASGDGKPYLRLDYGPNYANNGVIDYHWNVDGRAAKKAFPNIADHMAAGDVARRLYKTAKAFRVYGRTFIVYGAIMDGVSIVVADRPWRRSLQVVSAWTAAEVLGAQSGRVGAVLGTGAEPGLGTMIGGLVFATAGAIVGYIGARAAVGAVYDWADGTLSSPAQQVPVPAE